MKTKHTPGPWIMQVYDGHEPDGDWPGRIIGGDGATVFAGPFSFRALRGKGWKQAAANATLIAASPDLLAACETEEAMLSNLLGDIAAGRPLNGERMKEGLTLRRDALRAAIARANPPT